MSSDDPRAAAGDRSEPGDLAGTGDRSLHPPPARWALASFLHARALALVSICAFVSLWTQLEGLYGERGLTPVQDLFAALRERGDIGPLALPTLAWLSASSTMLALLCGIGTLASALLFLGVFPRAALLVAWAAYLSLVNAGLPWTAFQWDLLLVEVLLASTLFVPGARIDRFDPREEPSRAGRWLVWLVLFRLMFRSGIVKLASGDPTWADLSALDYHFFTQPLPTVPGWYAAHLPPALTRIACALMLGIELGLPFLIFVPRPWARRTAAAGFGGLMSLIAVTGNYGFFNLLTLVLALSLVDDAVWQRILPARFLRSLADRDEARDAEPDGEPDASTGECPRVPPPPTPTATPARSTGSNPSAPSAMPAPRIRSALALLLTGLGMLGFASGLGGHRLTPSTDPLAALRPFRSLNDYGLFAVMTTHRPEIELEGSADGRRWTPYRFRFKVGPLDRAPVWCAPHQPRLDWQMWFAALDPEYTAPWLQRLMERLVVNEASVLDLLAGNPFPDEPPRFVRATLYEYRPTSLAERARTGAWWRRERIGPYGVMATHGAP